MRGNNLLQLCDSRNCLPYRVRNHINKPVWDSTTKLEAKRFHHISNIIQTIAKLKMDKICNKAVRRAAVIWGLIKTPLMLLKRRKIYGETDYHGNRSSVVHLSNDDLVSKESHHVSLGKCENSGGRVFNH